MEYYTKNNTKASIYLMKLDAGGKGHKYGQYAMHKHYNRKQIQKRKEKVYGD